MKDDSDKRYDYSDRDQLTGNIIKVCYYVHTKLGAGFVERIYQNALKIALEEMKLNYDTEKEFQVEFDNHNVGKFRVVFLVEDKVIVEIKAVESKMPKIFESQVISYLKASGLSVGLLVNFGNRRCEIRRLMTSP